MRFFISSYGHGYVPYLSVCLSSLVKNHPDDWVDVFIGDTPQHEILLLRTQFSRVNFKEVSTSASQYKSSTQSIPAKLEHWAKYIKNVPSGEIVAFLDADLLIYKNIKSSLPSDFDIVYTWKNEKWPLNTGVLIVKASSNVVSFLQEWHQKTIALISDSKKLKQAIQTSGGGDQHTLLEMMDAVKPNPIPKGSWKKEYEFGKINFYGASCEELNQTNSVSLNADSKIFHYKSGMRPVILGDGQFTKARPPETSYEIWALWENTYRQHNKEALKNLILKSINKPDLMEVLAQENYESRGILNSEMLAVLTLINDLDIDLLIESGRARGQSTYILAKYLQQSKVEIHSIELTRDSDALFAEQRLASFENVNLHYGDSHHLISQILKSHPNKKVALLIDGPKGRNAFRLLSETLTETEQVVVGFIHDLNLLTEGKVNLERCYVDKFFDRVFLTDDGRYVEATKKIDIQSELQTPYHKGAWYIGSYGPTLGIIFTTVRDRVRAVRKKSYKYQIKQVFRNLFGENNYQKIALLKRKIKL